MTVLAYISLVIALASVFPLSFKNPPWMSRAIKIYYGIIAILFVALLLINLFDKLDLLASLKMMFLFAISIIMINLHQSFMDGTGTLRHILIWTFVLFLMMFVGSSGWMLDLFNRG